MDNCRKTDGAQTLCKCDKPRAKNIFFVRVRLHVRLIKHDIGNKIETKTQTRLYKYLLGADKWVKSK